MTKTLIKGGTIISMDRKTGDFAKGDILVNGSEIEKIGKSIRSPGAKVIDATGMIVMPGFVNAHLHTWQTGIRGVAGNWSIPEYLHQMHATIAPRYTAKDTYLGNLVGALNQINLGATTIFDWCHNNSTPAHSDAGVRGLQESGIRALFGHGSPKPDAAKGARHFSEIPHPRNELERLRNNVLSNDDALVTLAMSALGVDFSTWEVVEHDFRLAKELDLIISTHVWGAPNRLNPDGYKKLAKLKLLDRRHNMVHGNYLSDAELKLLIDCGASTTITPEVEIQMGHGNPLIGRVRALGGKPSIGIDVECNISGDMFTVMRMAMQPQRLLDNQATFRKTKAMVGSLSIEPREALEWATINAARAMGLDKKVGSLKPGKQADIILINGNDLNLFPVHNPIESVVFQAHGGNVDTVMIAGKIQKQNGKLKYRGLRGKMDELAKSGRRILKGIKLAA
ncbi:MAG: amidohydrolase family protein [Rhodospirillaceae bacterium]|jgi:5-methylthioadenosine/S-adenosylhomocysteine deaminase|nr:amidohydrolase family protein [Rhodospirillaceae bacterium]MBT5943721.1 amidohydrolase family protein [Rhodospirillaceae bacterium]MBT6405383.1 amidohydrolase family protein [Rhodospirillaceae bacterium]MBT6536245.1 amidohydrolase family protein [Rhodospirillaceae bacterium]